MAVPDTTTLDGTDMPTASDGAVPDSLPAVAPPPPPPVEPDFMAGGMESFDASELDELDLLADGNLSRRAKTLACTVPLHEMESVKGSVRGGAFKKYTLWSLAFVAIDTVCVHMDFDRGADSEM